MTRSRLAQLTVRSRLAAAAMRQRGRLLRDHFALQSDRSVYLALAVLEQRRHEPSRDSGPLTRYELRCFSQNGEDGVLAEILARIGVQSRFFVEFGIQDGSEGTCLSLADVEGWHGLFIEANRVDHARLEQKYQGVPAVQTVNAFVSPQNIERLFAEASVPIEPDVISIDIDGHDYWVWKAIHTYRPRIVVIEYNSALPARARWVTPPDADDRWDGTDRMGSSLAAFESLAAEKGYVLVHTELTALNAFFVRDDLASGRFPDPVDVPRRLRPNYNLAGVSHLPDPLHRPHLDLDNGER